MTPEVSGWLTLLAAAIAVTTGCLIALIIILVRQRIAAVAGLQREGGALRGDLAATRADLQTVRLDLAAMRTEALALRAEVARAARAQRLQARTNQSMAEAINGLRVAITSNTVLIEGLQSDARIEAMALKLKEAMAAPGHSGPTWNVGGVRAERDASIGSTHNP